MGVSVHPTRGLIMSGGLANPQEQALNVVEATVDGTTVTRISRMIFTGLGCHCQVNYEAALEARISYEGFATDQIFLKCPCFWPSSF